MILDGIESEKLLHDAQICSDESDNDQETFKTKRTSGTGILEFSPNMAGNDVTPANLDFSKNRFKKCQGNSFYSLTGECQLGLSGTFFSDSSLLSSCCLLDTLSQISNAVKPVKTYINDFKPLREEINLLNTQDSRQVSQVRKSPLSK